MCKKGQILENVTIEKMAAEGKCLVRQKDQVIFVTGVAPGDQVDIKILGRRKKVLHATPLTYHRYSDLRVEPFCSHFGTCGGCKWMHVDYDSQLENKSQQVVDNLSRIGKVQLPEVSPIIGSDSTQYYRNKLEFTFSDKRWLSNEEMASEAPLEKRGLGFHIPQRFNKVLDIDHCYLQREPSNEIRLAVRNYALDNNLSFFDINQKMGLLRNLIIRTSSTGELMVILQFGQQDEHAIPKVMNFVKNAFPQITSLMYVINTKGNDTFHDLEVKCHSGNPHIMEEMQPADLSKPLIFRIGPKSFFQTNTDQANRLYQVAVDFAELRGNELVFDLYSGIGTIANFLAHRARKVIGMEFIPEAIEDARVNAQINQISNTEFLAGDIKDLLKSKIETGSDKPEVIISDPPRAGMDAKVVQQLWEIEAEKIVYISCNPATQARDIALLSEKYEIAKVQPVDMFPHTHHVENVVLLKFKV